MPVKRLLQTTLALAAFAALLCPLPARAAGFLMTGFVPELSTVTAEVQYGYHFDSILARDLNVSTVTARLAYVAYPGVEAGLDLDYLSYDFDLGDGSESGFGAALFGRYQVPAFFEGVDLSAAAVLDFGRSDSISEYGVTALLLGSSDIAEGLTPCAGVGLSFNRQEFDGGSRLYTVYERRVDPVAFVGVKYMWDNAVGAQIELDYQDGPGLAMSVSYRF